MIKTFHEAPLSIFKEVQAATDGDYALVNLFDTCPEYYAQMCKAVKNGREVILDNGVFELGKAFQSDVFAKWIEELQPTYYIVPDVLENGPATVDRFMEFIDLYKGLPGKIIGVAQGATPKEFVKCYQRIEPYCDKVGISFDCSWYEKYSNKPTRWEKLMEGRYSILMFMADMGYINTKKPHHLLGVALPQDMIQYRDIPWIDSVDTSNPVVHGLKGIKYMPDDKGLATKETQKLYTLIESEVDYIQHDLIMHNILEFRRYCNG